MRKVVLVLPNSAWFDTQRWSLYPYNVCLLAAVLEPDFKVEIIDCNADDLSLDSAVARLRDATPDCIGISCLAVEYAKHAHALAAGVKAAMPDVPVVLGGVYCTLLPEHAMANPAIDCCVLGEGEIVFKSLLRCLEQGRLPDTLDGVAYRNNGSLVIKPQRDFIENLDDLPLPAFEKVDFDKYSHASERFSFTDTRDAVPAAKIYTSRGCPAGCNFCAVEHIAGRRFRARSVESILTEMHHLIDTYGVREFVFYDDNVLFNRNRAKRLFREIIHRKLDVKIKPANVAVYALDKELLDLMKAAGCTMLVFAIESASNRVLKEIMGKPLRIDAVTEIVDDAKQLGFRCAALFVIGNPGETWDEIRRTFEFAESLDVYCHFSIATPLPKTRLLREAREKNYLTADYRIDAGSGCSRGWLVTDAFSPFDLEMLRVYEWDRINFSTMEKRERSAAFFKVTTAEIGDFARSARKAVQNRYVQDASKRLP